MGTFRTSVSQDISDLEFDIAAFYNPFHYRGYYYSDGTLNNTLEDMGTFNVYYGENKFGKFVIHGVFDVVPYMVWGNSKDDSTTIIDRFQMIFN